MGEGNTKQWGTDMRYVEGRGMGQGIRGKQDGEYRDFQEGKQGTFRKVGDGLTGVEKIEVLDGGR